MLKLEQEFDPCPEELWAGFLAGCPRGLGARGRVTGVVVYAAPAFALHAGAPRAGEDPL